MLDLLQELADRTQGGVLFLCPSRPELTARRPDWGGGRRSFSSVALEPLSEADADRLVDLLLAVDDLPVPVQRRIVERAEGNPFFLEEILRKLIDEGRIVRDGERWRASGDIGDVEIPDTVQAVLAARIDLLRGRGEARAAGGRRRGPGVLALAGRAPASTATATAWRTSWPGSRTASSCSAGWARAWRASASSSSSTC